MKEDKLAYYWRHIPTGKTGRTERRLSDLRLEAHQFSFYTEDNEKLLLKLFDRWTSDIWQYSTSPF